jgi:LysM repeat protein
VEPANGSVKGSDSKGRYVDELVVKYHKVAKGETLSKIARKYGVTVASIRKSNGMSRKKKVRRGQRLKINTYQRRYIKDEPAVATAEVEAAAVADSTAVERSLELGLENRADSLQQADQASQAQQIAAEQPKAKAQPQPKAKTKSPKTTRHKVRKGESLDKIAKRYGITLAALKAANPKVKSNKIQIGQTIIVPEKTSKNKRR